MNVEGFGDGREPALQARAVLRDHGLRCTVPRLAVTTVFFSEPHAHHLSAHDIADHLSRSGHDVDASTIYRTLTSLVEIGVLHALTAADRTTTYGLTRQPHHHAVCANCGAIIEIPAEQLAAAINQVARQSRFELATTSALTLHGTCPDCLPRADRAEQ